MNASLAMQIRELDVRFHDLTALSGLALEVGDDEVVALIGPSGCGKSTLLRAVAGIIPGMTAALVEGEISLFGRPPSQRQSGEVDMVFQESCLLPWRQVKHNISLGLEILGKSRNNGAITEILKAIGLTEFSGNRPRQLSGGMKQRVALAAALITHPRLLLMDEPFANLDSLTRETMWQLVERLHLAGSIRSALLVTHSIEEAVVLADRVLVMCERPGRIVGDVSVSSLSRPRIGPSGLLVDGFGVVANQVRWYIREGNQK